MAHSPASLWALYRSENSDAPEAPIASYHFCDNAEDAATCLQLVLDGQKRATACSLKELELCGDPVPQAGDLNVVTDFAGDAHAIIRTTSVELKKFSEVDAEFARAEGEGDLSLEWWRDAHRAYFTRVLAGTDIAVDDDLMIACERFEVVFTV
ncbi:MAG: ASCH domain-containing protein [Erythrobacter sp.]